MRSLISIAAVLLLLAAAPRDAQAQPATSWRPASPSNYTHLSSRSIDRIVIHKAEGTLDGTVSWFQDPQSQVSAHYVVSETEIVQCVHDMDRAWHAGNGDYNARSIGIENDGYNDRDDFTDAHYRKLASLVGYLCTRYGIPVDRQHIIGHAEVPDPNHPGQFGGSGHHTCPGPYFQWGLFMTYVAQAAGVAAPAASASAGLRGVTATTNVNVRDAAGGAVLGTAATSSSWIRAGDEDQGYVPVWFRGTTGWVYASYLASASGTACAPSTSGLNVRSGPSTQDAVVGQVSQGQGYVKVGVSADGAWALVRFDESSRWISRAYADEVAFAP